MNFVKKNIFTLAIVLIFSFTIYIYGFSGGVTGKTRKNGNGCTCHGSFSSDVNVSINGPDTMEPGATENFTLTISGGPLVAGGTNIAASAGDLFAGEGLQLISGELTHQQPKSPIGGVVTFDFSFTAPSAEGEITLFANGNSVNLNGGSSGDSWNFAPNKIIQVKNPTDIESIKLPNSFALNQNYPNPFNPSTTISYEIPEAGFVQLKVYNSIGQEITTLVNEYKEAGKYNTEFSPSTDGNNYQLPSGIYFYQLKSGNFSETRKMILMK